MSNTYHNPIIPGFYPDPSICRVEEEYYLVTSTFEFFPGLPVFHSRDLVHWRQIGHVLDRPSQLNLDGLAPSRGLYAPTIRYHNGAFYVINTLVKNKDTQDLGHGEYSCLNFIVTAADPCGPWSEPYWLEDAPGIDPSLFFDEDGRAWYTGNRIPEGGESFRGHREIWLQELDLERMQLKGKRYGLWDGAVKGGVHAEAPHLYKVNGLYYLLIAEGGTGHNHAVTIARSKKITGPYESNPRNPILTHRHLGQDYPIVGTGHSDLVETHQGEWWLVLLAMRPYGGYAYNLGRETFLAPVRWEEGWPVVSPGIGRVEFEHPAPALSAHPWPARPACDHFEADTLDFCWNFLRTPREEFWSLTDRPRHLRLKLRPETLNEWANPSLVCRRQQHMDFSAQAAMDFTPSGPNETAGLAVFQNDSFHYRLVVAGKGPGQAEICLFKRACGKDELAARQPIRPGTVYLKIEARGQEYSFYASDTPGQWQPIFEGADGRILNTEIAGGFIGAYLGLYASSNGEPSQSTADFDWFEYRSLDFKQS
ncbi:MAG: glycoside hydrolase family 43 protein [Anaerolineales bacterium]|nr:glycoside hydrolase family 43 protein [Anaerolineales bacterium]